MYVTFNQPLNQMKLINQDKQTDEDNNFKQEF